MTDTWDYIIPNYDAVPKEMHNRVSDSRVLDDPEWASLCIGIYCRESSHESRPWLIGSLEPNEEWLERTGAFRWTFTRTFRTGDHIVLPTAGERTQLLTAEGKAAVDAQGLTDWHAAERGDSRGRWRLRCKMCGLSIPVREETLQVVGNVLRAAGCREAPLSSVATIAQRAGSLRARFK